MMRSLMQDSQCKTHGDSNSSPRTFLSLIHSFGQRGAELCMFLFVCKAVSVLCGIINVAEKYFQEASRAKSEANVWKFVNDKTKSSCNYSERS